MADSRKLKYKVNLSWDNETGGEVQLRGSHTLRVDLPADFGGKGRYPCPDELLFSAVGGCILTTFLYFKEKLHLKVDEMRISVDGSVGMTGPEGYRVTGIDVLVRVRVKEDQQASAEKCLQYATTYCHITRSLERCIPINLSTSIETSR